MKKLLYILFAVTLFASCSSSDDNNDTPSQNYTSFQVRNDATEGVYSNIVAGYRQSDNTLKRIAALGDIKAGQSSEKITLTDKNIKTVELFFTGLKYDGSVGSTRPLGQITIQENQNEMFAIPSDFTTVQTVDPTDPTQYPIN